MSAERLAKYEAWIRELEARQETLARSRKGYLRFFSGALLASPLGFLWSLWIGAGTLFTGVLFCAFGFYAVLTREGDYTRELEATRRAAMLLRRGDDGSASPR